MKMENLSIFYCKSDFRYNSLLSEGVLQLQEKGVLATLQVSKLSLH